MNALLEALYPLSIKNHRNSCKTRQGAWDASPKMKVALTATLLMQQHNPHSTWTGNFIIYQVLYVLMSRNKHSYRKAVIKRRLSEPLSLDKAVKFSYISQWLMAQRIKQGYVPTFPSVSASGAALLPRTLHRRHLECWEQGSWAGNKSLLQGLFEATGKFVSTETRMCVLCAPALAVHRASEFHTGCLYRHRSVT